MHIKTSIFVLLHNPKTIHVITLKSTYENEIQDVSFRS